jgi:hypothetical protein
VLDLLTGVERPVALPPAAAAPERIGWRSDGSAVVLAAGTLWLFGLDDPEPRLVPVKPDRLAGLDSLTWEHLGEPPLATVRRCGDARACVVTPGGETDSLGGDATGAVRWGADSVGYFTPRGFQVRPLAGGASRRPPWRGVPVGLRQLTHHPGSS